MPSKGIQCYSYIAAPGCQVEFSAPGETITKDQLRVFGSDHLEVDSKHIQGHFNFTGTFAFKVTQNGNQIANESVEINAMNGSLGAGSLKSMSDQQSRVTGEVIVSYGFYDAGAGVVGLPSSGQCWVAVAPNYSSWMGQVAPPGSPQASKPFSKLFLPAAHDIGMNSMENASAVLQSDALIDVMKSINSVFAKVAGVMTHSAVKAIAPNIIAGLAITQKDTLDVILSIGARYFEFRPAYLHKAIRDHQAISNELYFSHSAIPGMSYKQFLHDTVDFLLRHPDEIVVVQLRWDGVPGDCAHPSDEDMANYLNEALAPSNGSLSAGSLDDMRNLSIAELRDQHKRLILFVNSDSFSTYTDEGNATLTGDPIVAQLNNINADVQAGKPFTNIQCQATATNIADVVAYSVLAADVSSSCLLATKPICDSKTLPWIKENGGRLVDGQLTVVMNDFLDGATADVCVERSRQRLE